jgi:hypothetical protein
MTHVKPMALKVPLGIDLEGSLSSPDMLAPAIIPVTPLNKTPKTVAKEARVPSADV